MELIKDDIYRWVGAGLILVGLVFVLASMGIILDAKGTEDIITGMLGAGLCTVVFLIPGIILFITGWKMGIAESDQEKLAAYLKTYRTFSINEAAKVMGKSEAEAEDLMVDCVKMGLVQGYIDREKREFIVDDINLYNNELNALQKPPSSSEKVASVPVEPLLSREKSKGLPELSGIECPYCKKAYEVEKGSEHLLKKCPNCGMPRMLDM